MLLSYWKKARMFYVLWSTSAFNTMPHLVLLQKLQRYGVPSYILSWLANVRTDRTRAVASQAGTCIKLAITFSIVQGSGIGPMSFVAIP